MLFKKKIPYFVLVFIIGIVLTFWKVPVLVLEDITVPKTVFLHRVSPGDEFTVAWMHSVELQPWEEIFKIDDDYNLILDRTRFKSFGAGVPNEAGEKSEIKDGWVIFSGINKIMPEITYGISDYGKHMFYYKNYEIKLYENVPDGNGLKIKTDRVNLLSYLLSKS